MVTAADDAFGTRIGLEQIGLYRENEVRGFNLQDSGNFRLDDSYFVKSIDLSDTVLNGVTIRVGVNALGADFPAPSGVVDYALRTPEPGVRLTVQAGVRNTKSPLILSELSAASADGRLGVVGGFNAYPMQTYVDGATAVEFGAGVSPQWRPTPSLTVKGFFSWVHGHWDGDYGFVPTGDRLPAPPTYPGRYTPSWAIARQDGWNAGLIAEQQTPRYELAASAFYSLATSDHTDFTSFTIDENGLGDASAFLSRPRRSASTSGEIRGAWRFTPSQRIFMAARARASQSLVRPSDLIPLGAFDEAVGLTPSPTPAPAAPMDPAVDRVHQYSIGVGYDGTFAQRLRIRLGGQRSSYSKSSEAPGQPRASSDEGAWLYDGALVYALAKQSSLFATVTRGLEETGVAPPVASNRYAVLPPVIGSQFELGVRQRLTPKLTLIASAFETSKPTPGLDAGNVYRIVGDETHRGLELSVAGQVTQHLSVVAGAVAMRARRSGDLVSAGLISSRVVGVSATKAMASVNYQLPMLPRLSVDASAFFSGPRSTRAASDLFTPGFTTLDLGARYRLNLDGREAELRVRVANVFDKAAWNVDRSGTMRRTSPRTLWATVTVPFSLAI